MNKVDVCLYCLIAGLTALISTHPPLDWRQVAGVVLSVLVTYKAKRSPGHVENDAPPSDAGSILPLPEKRGP